MKFRLPKVFLILIITFQIKLHSLIHSINTLNVITVLKHTEGKAGTSPSPQLFLSVQVASTCWCCFLSPFQTDTNRSRTQNLPPQVLFIYSSRGVCDLAFPQLRSAVRLSHLDVCFKWMTAVIRARSVSLLFPLEQYLPHLNTISHVYFLSFQLLYCFYIVGPPQKLL